jgi:hypothetical protein
MLEFLLQGRFDGGSLSRGSFEIRSSTMTREPGSPRSFRWSAPSARPGRYRILLSPVLGFAAEVDTGPNGARDVRIEVPRPADVSVHCVDAETGVEVHGEKLSFLPLSPKAFGPSMLGGPPKFRVPHGRIVLFTTPVLYEPAVRLVELGPGKNELRLLLRKKP